MARLHRRTAPRAVVELPEGHPSRGEGVEMRRPDLAAHAAEIGEPHVVGQDEDDVRPLGRVGHGCDSSQEDGEEMCELRSHDDTFPAGRALMAADGD